MNVEMAGFSIPQRSSPWTGIQRPRKAYECSESELVAVLANRDSMIGEVEKESPAVLLALSRGRVFLLYRSANRHRQAALIATDLIQERKEKGRGGSQYSIELMR